MEHTKLISLKKEDSQFEKVKISSSQHAADYMKKFYHDDIEIYESFFILLMNRANETIGYAKISQGGITSTTVDVKIIAKYVVDSLASAVILAHNHPSGVLKPSNSDIQITDKIKSAMKYFDTTILDHLILTREGHYSLADNGDM